MIGDYLSLLQYYVVCRNDLRVEIIDWLLLKSELEGLTELSLAAVDRIRDQLAQRFSRRSLETVKMLHLRRAQTEAKALHSVQKALLADIVKYI